MSLPVGTWARERAFEFPIHLEEKSLNIRALALYASEGFVEEGRLRERVRESMRVSGEGASGYDSLVVMSLLDREYQARVALSLELGH